MELLQLWLLLNIASKFGATVIITIKQNFKDDHSLDTNTVITIASASHDKYNIMYQDLTCLDDVSTCKLNKTYLKSYLTEIMKRDCLPGETVITVEEIIGNDRFFVGSLTTELNELFLG